jgi:SHS2 domain-containing protein
VNFRFLEDEATADVAFETWGKGLPDVFKGAADAVVNVMVENPGDIRPNEQRRFELQNDRLDLLLYNFLEQIVYYKDAERFLGNISGVEVTPINGAWRVSAVAKGEKLDPERHLLRVDVKAITLHEFTLAEERGQWRAHVVLDI